MKKYKKTCNFCGEIFYPKRIDAKTCSNTCRVYLHELRTGIFDEEKYSEYAENNVNKHVIPALRTFNNVKITDEEKLKQFFIKHKKQITEYVIELDLYTEDEYAEVADIAMQATNLLYKLRDTHQVDEQFFAEIDRIEYEYELKQEEEEEI